MIHKLVFFSHRFLHLYLVYFDSTEFVFKLGIEEEDVAVIHITALKKERKEEFKT